MCTQAFEKARLLWKNMSYAQKIQWNRDHGGLGSGKRKQADNGIGRVGREGDGGSCAWGGQVKHRRTVGKDDMHGKGEEEREKTAKEGVYVEGGGKGAGVGEVLMAEEDVLVEREDGRGKLGKVAKEGVYVVGGEGAGRVGEVAEGDVHVEGGEDVASTSKADDVSDGEGDVMKVRECFRCACVYTYTCVCMCIYACVYVYVVRRFCRCVCVYIHICVYVYICICMCVRTYMYTQLYVYIFVCIYICICTYIYIYIYARILTCEYL